MNLNYEISRDEFRSTPELTVRMQAAGAEVRGFIRALIEASVSEGERIARAEAPRGKSFDRNSGTISDSIQTTPVRYHPGGSGGGGFYEADLFASGAIAPHLKYVFEGTAGQGAEKIRGNLKLDRKGRLRHWMAVEKEGEGVRFRSWIHGQAKQDEWWDLAREAVEAHLQAGIDSFELPS